MAARRQYPGINYLQMLARKSGRIMVKHFSPYGTPSETKGDNTPLTIADIAINNMVMQRLAKDFLHVRFIGEEGCNQISEAEYTVMLDPIDGTIPFAIGVPTSSFAISVFRGGKPFLGLIYNPFTNQMWWGSENGAFLNGKRVRVSSYNTLERRSGFPAPMVWVGTWKDAGWNIEKIIPKIIQMGGLCTTDYTLAYYGGLTASGKVLGTVFPGYAGWETAAMQPIVEAAGGIVTDLNGKGMRYDLSVQKASPTARVIHGHIMSNCREVHDVILGMVYDVNPVRKAA